MSRSHEPNIKRVVWTQWIESLFLFSLNEISFSQINNKKQNEKNLFFGVVTNSNWQYTHKNLSQ